MGDLLQDHAVKLVPLAEPRPLTSEERELVDFLLSGPLGRGEFRDQAATARVASECGCGCGSIGFDVDPSTSRAQFGPDETILRRTDWVPISAVQHESRETTEVTLHVLDGRLHELEIWSGDYGVKRRVDVIKLERGDWTQAVGRSGTGSSGPRLGFPLPSRARVDAIRGSDAP
jgi:hypothetical protein